MLRTSYRGLHLIAAAIAVGRSSKAEALRVEVPVLPSRTASVCLIYDLYIHKPLTIIMAL